MSAPSRRRWQRDCGIASYANEGQRRPAAGPRRRPSAASPARDRGVLRSGRDGHEAPKIPGRNHQRRSAGSPVLAGNPASRHSAADLATPAADPHRQNKHSGHRPSAASTHVAPAPRPLTKSGCPIMSPQRARFTEPAGHGHRLATGARLHRRGAPKSQDAGAGRPIRVTHTVNMEEFGASEGVDRK